MTPPRPGSRRRGRKARQEAPPPAAAVWPGLAGGRYRPLTAPDEQRIHHTILDVLENIGMGDPIPIVEEKALERGGLGQVPSRRSEAEGRSKLNGTVVNSPVMSVSVSKNEFLGLAFHVLEVSQAYDFAAFPLICRRQCRQKAGGFTNCTLSLVIRQQFEGLSLGLCHALKYTNK